MLTGPGLPAVRRVPLNSFLLVFTVAILIAIGWDIFSRSPLSRYPRQPQASVMEPLRAIATIPMPNMVVYSAAFSPDGKRLVVAGRTNAPLTVGHPVVCACDLENPESVCHFQLSSDGGGLHCAAISPDMKSVALGTDHKDQVRVFDVATGKVRWSASLKWGVTCLAWSPDSSHLAAGSHDATVTIWDAEGKNERIALKPPPNVPDGQGGTVFALVWSHDCKRIVSVDNGTFRLWEAKTGREIAIAVDDAFLRQRAAEKGLAVATTKHDCFHYSPRPAFAPDDRSVLIAGRTIRGSGEDYPDHVWVWDLEANREGRSFAEVPSFFIVAGDARQLIALSWLPKEESIKHPDVAFTVHGRDFETGRRLWAGAVILDRDKGESSTFYTNPITPDGRRVTLFWNTRSSAPDSGRVTIFELPPSSP